jgi:hypothetical protein
MVGVLSEDHHLDPVERGRVQRIENLWPGWKNDCAAVLALEQKFAQGEHVRAFELITQTGAPTGFQPDITGLGHGSMYPSA